MVAYPVTHILRTKHLFAPVIVAVFSLPLGTALADGSEVKGKIAVESAPREAPRETYLSIHNGALPLQAQPFSVRRHLAVVLEGTATTQITESTLQIRGGDFYPTTVAVRSATSMKIQNTDPCDHAIRSSGWEGETIPLVPADTKEHAVPSTGVWWMRDVTYPHMQAYVHVLPRLVSIAEISSRGNFTFENIESGDYTLKVLFQDRVVHTRGIVVGESGAVTLEDSIALRLGQKP